MKRVLKVTGAVCLGIFIWILVCICIVFALNSKMESITEELGITAKEAKADTSGSQAESHDGEGADLTINVTGNSFSTQESGKENIYYDSMQEALLNSTISLNSEEQYRRNIDEEIKLFENDKYALLFYRSIKDKKEEAFNLVRFRVQSDENNNKRYRVEHMTGSILEYNSMFWGNASESIESALWVSEIEKELGINLEKERFVYGMIREDFFEEGESIENLKIEGQKPDEIIEYESFGKTWYFWYYNDLQSDKKYDELEFTIKEEQ